jgi:hypothetical protein
MSVGAVAWGVRSGRAPGQFLKKHRFLLISTFCIISQQRTNAQRPKHRNKPMTIHFSPPNSVLARFWSILDVPLDLRSIFSTKHWFLPVYSFYNISPQDITQTRLRHKQQPMKIPRHLPVPFQLALRTFWSFSRPTLPPPLRKLFKQKTQISLNLTLLHNFPKNNKHTVPNKSNNQWTSTRHLTIPFQRKTSISLSLAILYYFPQKHPTHVPAKGKNQWKSTRHLSVPFLLALEAFWTFSRPLELPPLGWFFEKHWFIWV